jgi:hypothetical protein
MSPPATRAPSLSRADSARPNSEATEAESNPAGSNKGKTPYTYSKNKYRQDSVLLLAIRKEYKERTKYANLVRYLTTEDVSMATAIYRLESANMKQSLFKEANAILERKSGNDPTMSLSTFRAWLDQFRLGPSASEGDPEGLEVSGDEVSHAPSRAASEQVQGEATRPASDQPGRNRPSTSSGVVESGNLNEVLRRLQQLEDRQNRDVRESMAPRPLDERIDNPYDGRYDQRPSRLDRAGMARRDRRATTSEPNIHHHYQSGPSVLNPGLGLGGLAEEVAAQEDPFGSKSRVRPNDIMVFDPHETKVAFFVRRCQHMAEIEGERAILRVLPMCLKGEALEWYTSLSDPVRRQMNGSLAAWETQLLSQYRPNRFDALREAEKLKFRFFRAETMPLNLYFTKKINLLEDAGINDPDMIVQHLHAGLEPHLALVSTFKESNNSVDEFIRNVRFHEPAAKRVWESSRRETMDRAVKRPFLREAEPNRIRQPAPEYYKKPLALPAPPKKGGRKPLRPCRHCSGDHWDNECPTARKRSVAYKTEVEELEEADEEDSDSKEEEYQRQQVQYMESTSSESDESKNDS